MVEYSFLDNFMLMKKTDEYMLGRIKWKFNKYKISNNYTFFFEELSPSIQAYLRTSIDEHLSGIPVIFLPNLQTNGPYFAPSRFSPIQTKKSSGSIFRT
jgi:hypothetical protein